MTPGREMGAAGPFDHWPLGWGFDHWWGFLTGAAGQYDPIITQDNSTLGVPEGEDGKLYYFPDDITDKSVEWLHAVRAQDAAEAVVHVLLDRLQPRAAPRRQGVGRQVQGQVRRRLGRVPRADARAPEEARASSRRTPSCPSAPTSSPPGTRSATPRRSSTRARWRSSPASPRTPTGTSAACSTPIEEMGELDNTLVIYIWGDNGASMEGTLTGSFNETTFFNGVVLEADEQLEIIEKFGGVEELGGFHTAPHFAAAWAHANNTPVPVGQADGEPPGRHARPDGRRVAEPHRSRTRPCAPSSRTASTSSRPSSSWSASPSPRRSTASTRSRWTAPASRTRSTTRRRAEQHTVQYFEIYGSRAIYKDGWWACAKLDKLPWDFSPATLQKFGPGGTWDPEQDTWELYYLPDDFSQAHDLAAENPEKLAELKELFWQEAERNRVLPLLGGFAVFFGMLPPMPTVTRFAFAGDVQNIQTTMIPRIIGRSYAIEAELHVPEGGAEGVLVRLRRLHRRVRALGRRERPAQPHLPVPRAWTPTSRPRPSRSRPAT